ncbi:MarR family winged helix-turn-helix transcriptional regulator [Hyphococcus sp.]|jgi:DNA-binding MarR family transcriptional regulator|uniref:MarR family winged helix-turn-helix transcriptional regulator n=1 Tax=Hyphococcus sp. TaxID=2038636 RepID=UPI003D0BF5F6
MNKASLQPARRRTANANIEPLDVLHRLLKLGNRLGAPFSEHLEKRHRVTMNEFRVIMLIGRLGKAASHEIAEISGVTTMSVSRAVTSLERKGRIACKVDPQNRRRKILRLTKEGERLYQKMLPTADNVATYLFNSLQPEEVRAFDSIMAKLIDSLDARDADGRSVFIEKTRPEN